METAAQVLLIIVSAILAIFLLALVILAVYIIKFLRRADQVADSFESAATAIRRSASAMPFVRLATNLFNKSRKRKAERNSND
ncbi:MAG: hypothetical protein WD877_02130 [Candidatus Saccharimonadales bacterium]